jgi:hypothetical protein
MKHKTATRYSAVQRGSVAQIAFHTFGVEFAEIARRAAQRANLMTSLGEQAGDVPTQEAGGSGDERWFQEPAPLANAGHGAMVSLRKQPVTVSSLREPI